MTPIRAKLGDAPDPGGIYVVTLDDALTTPLVQREERHYISPTLTSPQALELATAFISTPVATTGSWLLPAAGGQTVVVLRAIA